MGRVAILAAALEMRRRQDALRGETRPNSRASRWKAAGRAEQLNHWPGT